MASASWMPDVRARLAGAGLDPARELEIAQELCQHLEDRYRDLVAAGHDAAAARQLTLEELAEDRTMREQLAKVESRESPLPPAGSPPRGPLLQGVLQDVRYAVRLLRRAPGFAALAVLTLALGVGATTVVYAIVDNVLLRPVPYDHVDRLVRVFEVREDEPGRSVNASIPNFADWQARSRTIEVMGVYRSTSLVLLDDEPQRVTAGLATPGYFAAAGVGPQLGRHFTEADTAPGAAAVVVLSHEAWRRRYGADPQVVGRTLATLDGPREIVGVLAPARMFAGGLEFWLPFQRSPAASGRSSRFLWVLGRLRDGVTLETAQAEMSAIAAALAAEHPESNRGWTVRLTPMQEWSVGHLRQPLYTFLGAVACILLIACINVSGLLVARGQARLDEIGVRAALGASRARIVRQLLTESVILSLAGAAAGALLAWWWMAALVPLFPLSLPAERIAVDVRVLGVAAAAAAVTGILFGILPAFGLSRAASTLRDRSRSTSRWGARVGRVLITVEVALSLVLLAGAGLMVRTLANLDAVHPGFDMEGVAVLRATPLVPSGAPPARAAAFYARLIERIEGMPGVASAAAISTLPFSGSSVHGGAFAEGGDTVVPISPRTVTPRYFETMRIAVAAGRDFDARDTAGAPRVAVVNEHAAAALWPGVNPVGRRLQMQTGRETRSEPYEVVGVVGNVRHAALDSGIMSEVYFPFVQAPQSGMMLVARSAVPESTIAAFRGVLAGLPERAIPGTSRTLADMVHGSTRDRRNRAILLGVLGGLGLTLAAVGVFGLTAYSVAQRTREIGIRIALGADRRRVLRAILRTLASPLAAGLALGLAGSWAATRTLAAHLFGVRPTDAATFALAATVLAVVALIACYIPARRALAVDPVAALRN